MECTSCFLALAERSLFILTWIFIYFFASHFYFPIFPFSLTAPSTSPVPRRGSSCPPCQRKTLVSLSFEYNEDFSILHSPFFVLLSDPLLSFPPPTNLRSEATTVPTSTSVTSEVARTSATTPYGIRISSQRPLTTYLPFTIHHSPFTIQRPHPPPPLSRPFRQSFVARLAAFWVFACQVVFKRRRFRRHEFHIL
ncbi:hypothetical protein M430DRAFT_186783 [Amorphotheca resinae ATCC 22711]|uniref:Uncharacterized protein n=1 Tax=Amorphotheca resinae ATCC 22711 TaxID=857342 RepID=A0A2T3AQL2_AMORE|nr:hypothetical protein M430DRAFT_186783 [Amorphotheca resinae ATCC 22711]PSS08559.1 hypothetical protein M430DRAFT_186783 [Amorphotheca resinae ATCC 22711]